MFSFIVRKVNRYNSCNFVKYTIRCFLYLNYGAKNYALSERKLY